MTTSARLRRRVLRRNARRAVVGVAAQRLDAAEREHEAARRIAPVGAERHCARMSKAVTILPAAPMRMRVAQPDADQGVVHEDSSPSRIGMPRWSMNSSGAAPVPPSSPSTTMKSGQNSGLQHRLAMPEHSQGWPTQSLNPTGLPPESSRSSRDECAASRSASRTRYGCAGETQSTPICDAADRGDLRASPWPPGSTPPWPGLAPWRQLDLDHLDLALAAAAANFRRRKCRPALRQPK